MLSKTNNCKCGQKIWSSSIRCRSCAKSGKLNPSFGRIRPEAERKIVSEKQRGERNHQWKGSKVGYLALHEWVRKNFGQPKKCEHCGTDGLTKFQINWANKTGKYLRLRSDWLRLCLKCHRAHDRKLSANNVLEKLESYERN